MDFPNCLCYLQNKSFIIQITLNYSCLNIAALYVALEECGHLSSSFYLLLQSQRFLDRATSMLLFLWLYSRRYCILGFQRETTSEIFLKLFAGNSPYISVYIVINLSGKHVCFPDKLITIGETVIYKIRTEFQLRKNSG